MELDGVELFHAEAGEGAVDGGLDVVAVDDGKVREIRDELGEDLDALGVVGVVAAEVADEKVPSVARSV